MTPIWYVGRRAGAPRNKSPGGSPPDFAFGLQPEHKQADVSFPASQQRTRMSCVDEKDESLNALRTRPGLEKAPTITLEYRPYMN